jgi:g-D-glutamyl-meso-diaminopimelate peptidase
MIIDFDEPIYTYEKLSLDARTLAKQYQSILTCVTIGKSHDNRDILLLKLGHGKKHLIICSGVHGRETINPIVMMGVIEYYAKLYVNHRKQKVDLKNQLTNAKLYLGAEYEQMLYGSCNYELLQTFTILFVPLLNPDGYTIALESFAAIRDEKLKKDCMSRQIPHTEWKYNARGMDINRNFPCKSWYPGGKNDLAGSEKETQALIALFRKYASMGFLDFHSRGRSIYYFRGSMTDQYNEKQLKIAERLKEITNYELMPPQEEVVTGDRGGNTVHYYSEQFYKPALTIETVEEEAVFPLDPKYRALVFEEMKLILLEFGSIII